MEVTGLAINGPTLNLLLLLSGSYCFLTFPLDILPAGFRPALKLLEAAEMLELRLAINLFVRTCSPLIFAIVASPTAFYLLMLTLLLALNLFIVGVLAAIMSCLCINVIRYIVALLR